MRPKCDLLLNLQNNSYKNAINGVTFTEYYHDELNMNDLESPIIQLWSHKDSEDLSKPKQDKTTKNETEKPTKHSKETKISIHAPSINKYLPFDKYQEIIASQSSNLITIFEQTNLGFSSSNNCRKLEKLFYCDLRNTQYDIYTIYIDINTLNKNKRILLWHILYRINKEIYVLSLNWNNIIKPTVIFNHKIYQNIMSMHGQCMLRKISDRNSKYAFFLRNPHKSNILQLCVVDIKNAKIICKQIVYDKLKHDKETKKLLYEFHMELDCDILSNEYELIIEFVDCFNKPLRPIILHIDTKIIEYKTILFKHLQNMDVIDEILSMLPLFVVEQKNKINEYVTFNGQPYWSHFCGGKPLKIWHNDRKPKYESDSSTLSIIV